MANEQLADVHNHMEALVFRAIVDAAPGYPALVNDPDALADAACVALNRLPSRYVRHQTDLAFFQTEAQRQQEATMVLAAVEHALGYVQARNLMQARR